MGERLGRRPTSVQLSGYSLQIDLSKEYWNRVFQPALCRWQSGETPNPDVFCNKEIKFGVLLERLLADSEEKKPWLATGHYARKSWVKHPFPRPKLLRAVDHHKDQSYFLSSISEEGLSRALFPLGHLTKVNVRELAKRYGLPTASRPESMGICFVGKKARFSEFLSSYIPQSPGSVLNIETGDCVANHTGLWNYTIGQNIPIGGMPQKMFVVKKNVMKNIIFVAPGSNHEALWSKTLLIPDFSWIWADSPPADLRQSHGFRARVKHLYRMESVPCTVFSKTDSCFEHRSLFIMLDNPERAISPGQIAVLFTQEDDSVLGCGVIASSSIEGNHDSMY